MTKAVSFDAAGTLFHLPRGVGWHYAEVARRHRVDLPEGEWNRAFRAAWKALPRPAETRVARPDDDRGWWKALVARVLDDCRVGDRLDRAAFFDELWAEFVKPGVWELFPETHDVLAKLEGQYRLAVVSNFDSRLHRILPVLGISDFFDAVVVSSEVGADKPAAHIFHEAVRRLGVPPGETLHVGDEPEADWRGARAAGLQVFELRRPENSLRDLLPLL